MANLLPKLGYCGLPLTASSEATNRIELGHCRALWLQDDPEFEGELMRSWKE
jgi:hypothetical protein